MMKAYPEYKESELVWMGKVPKNWDVKPLKYLISEPIKTGKLDVNAGSSDGVYPFFTCSSETKKINSYSFDCEALLIAGNGDVGLTKYYNGKFDAYQRTYVVSGFSSVMPRFFNYAFNSMFFKYLEPMKKGSVIDFIKLPFLQNFPIAAPDIDEQKSIVAFLDVETTRIDKLIAEKENFIKLLQEKRKALISHVVTKGLNSNVPTKDSGVEWIDKIPEHWKVTKLRYLGKCQNGINIDGEAFGSGFPFVSYGDVYNNKALPSKVKGLVESTTKDREIYSVKSGDVLFTRTSETIDEIGFTSVSHSDMENAVFAGFLIRFRPKENAIDPLYSEYYFQNEKLRAFFVKEMNLVTRASLSQELLKRMPVTLPPVKEQKEIAEFISSKDKLISELAEEVKNSIELLKEHRTALISAAVTGKIDVREEV